MIQNIDMINQVIEGIQNSLQGKTVAMSIRRHLTWPETFKAIDLFFEVSKLLNAFLGNNIGDADLLVEVERRISLLGSFYQSYIETLPFYVRGEKRTKLAIEKVVNDFIAATAIQICLSIDNHLARKGFECS